MTFRGLLVAAGMTQVELSEKSGIKEATISACARYKVETRGTTLEKLSEAMHIDTDDLARSVESSYRCSIDRLNGEFTKIEITQDKYRNRRIWMKSKFDTNSDYMILESGQIFKVSENNPFSLGTEFDAIDKKLCYGVVRPEMHAIANRVYIGFNECVDSRIHKFYVASHVVVAWAFGLYEDSNKYVAEEKKSYECHHLKGSFNGDGLSNIEVISADMHKRITDMQLSILDKLKSVGYESKQDVRVSISSKNIDEFEQNYDKIVKCIVDDYLKD